MIQRKSYPNIIKLAEDLAKYAEKVLQETLTIKENAILVVPGGDSPRDYLPILAKCNLPWNKITIMLSDERWVDSNDHFSNEKMINEYLIQNIAISPHPSFVSLKTLHKNPANAIDEIHQRINRLSLPLNFTILGFGSDGHIASLFSDKDLVLSHKKHCIATKSSNHNLPRISLSLNILANSENIALIVPNDEKRKELDRILLNSNRSDISKQPILNLMQQHKSLITIFEVASDEVVYNHIGI